MPRLMAIEWDVDEVRFALANVRGSKVTLEQLGSSPLQSSAAETGDQQAESLSPSTNVPKPGRATVLVGVSRANVELRPLTLPPAPDVELPELVRMQALREPGFFNESSLLDYAVLEEDPAQPRHVLAAAMSAEQYELLDGACRTHGIKPERLLLRPFASASLVSRAVPRQDRIALLIDVTSKRADLVVMDGPHVLISRCVRLPQADDTAAAHASLVAEIRRTVISVKNQPGGRDVQAAYLLGHAGEDGAQAADLARDLGFSVEVIDPLAQVSLAGPLQHSPPAHRGRFASLVGMLLDEAHGGSHALDLLNPKRKPEPLDRRKVAAAVAVALALLMGAGGYVAWSKFAEIDEDIERYMKQSNELDALVKRADAKRMAVEEIDLWAGGEVIWLDELRDLSLRFPGPRDAVLLRLNMARSPGKGGVMDFQGLVRDPSIVARMETNLRDNHHEVRSKRVQASIQDRTYTWQFESSLSVTKRDKELYLTDFTPPDPPALPSVPNEVREAGSSSGTLSANTESSNQPEANPESANPDATSSPPAPSTPSATTSPSSTSAEPSAAADAPTGAASQEPQR